MLGIIGNLSLYVWLAASLSNIALLLRRKNAKLLHFICPASALVAMSMLIFGFISSDFSLRNVLLNSSTLSPLIYKIGASWSSHEGSMLLLISFFAAFSFYSYLAIPSSSILLRAHAMQQGIISILLINMLVSANPFYAISFTPPEGSGLNPSLQDIALLYHPPILYLGYACCFVIFSYCVFIYQDQKQQTRHFQNLLPTARFAMFFLTCGIGLGSWWAYRELGWGGFWFFDPVENISLLPWLCAISFHHSLTFSIKKQQLQKTTIFFGMLMFVLILFGMFLVRSNLLISVHSFALDITKAIALGALGLLSFATCAYSYYNYQGTSINWLNLYHKPAGFVIGNTLWLMAICSVLASIIIPILLSSLYDLEISLEAEYFKITLLPIFVLVNLVIAMYSYFSMRQNLLFALACCIAAGSLAALLGVYCGVKSLLASCSLLFSCFLIIVSSAWVLKKSNFLRKKLPHAQIAMFLGHISYAILTLSITLNALLEREVDLIGAKNTSVQLADFKVTLEDIKYSYGPNYLRQIAILNISSPKQASNTILKPENRWYVIENKMTSKSSIYSFLIYDLYAVLNRIQDDKAHLKIYYRPCISFIWLAGICLALSFLISTKQRRKSKVCKL